MKHSIATAAAAAVVGLMVAAVSPAPGQEVDASELAKQTQNPVAPSPSTSPRSTASTATSSRPGRRSRRRKRTARVPTASSTHVTTHALVDKGTRSVTLDRYEIVKAAEAKDPLMADRVVKSIEGQLAVKGLTKAAEGTAGACYVAYQAAVKETKGATINTMGGFGYGGRWGGGIGDIQSYTMKDGELVVDLFNSKKKMMWRATATDCVSDKPEKEAQKIEKAVGKMFEKFPPEAKK